MKEATTVLIVEDDVITLETIAEGLEDKGFDIITAENGIEALKILEETTKEIKTIILDWMMPEMSGLELLGLLKEDRKLKDIPVILQTAKTQSEFVIQGINQGAYQYLSKPFDEDVLYSMLRSAIAEYEKIKTLSVKAEKEIQLIRTSNFKDKIRWRTP